MKKKILLVVGILFGLMMLNAGLNKFFNYMPAMEFTGAAATFMTALTESRYFIYLVAIVEIVGGILFMIPKYRPVGAIVILPIVAGIFTFHLFLAPEGIIISIILLAINLWVVVENWSRYMRVIH